MHNEIKEMQGYLIKVGAFLSKIEFKLKELEGKKTVNEELDRFLDSFTNAPPRKNVALQLDIYSTATVEKEYVNFNQKEILLMPKKIQRLIILQGCRCRMRSHQSGKNGCSYEIRYRRNGYNISASGVTIEIAKQNFIKKLKTAQPVERASSIIPNTFNAFAEYYFENFYRPKVHAETFQHNMYTYNGYIKPTFLEMKINKVLPIQCKTLLDSIQSTGKGKTAESTRTLLNIIFKGAIAHGLIERNPLDTVLYIKHKRKTGTAVSLEDELNIYEQLHNHPYGKYIAVYMFTGLRPNEIAKFTIDGKFLIAVNSKRKNDVVKYKRIPILSTLKPFLAELDGKTPSLKLLRQYLKTLAPDHTLKDLRKTFNSRCKEYGVSDHARKHFMGHALGAVDETYTELTDSFLLKESKKLEKWASRFPKNSPKN